MAIKLKAALESLYRNLTGVPKSDLKSQGEMIRQDWKGKPGSDYRTKSTLLNTYDGVTNKFRPKGGKVLHALHDRLAPLEGTSEFVKVAKQIASVVPGGNPLKPGGAIGEPYADLDRINPFIKKSNSLEKRFGLDYEIENSYPTDADGEPLAGNFVDLIPVRIGEYQFRGAISGLTDNVNPSWTGANYAGRPDQIYSYSGFERTITFDLKLYVTTPDKLRAMYQRLNKLYDLTRPSADDLFQPKRMVAPLTRLTIGNYIRESVIMTALTVTPIEDLSWEINDPDLQHPSKTLSAEYTTLGGSIPFDFSTKKFKKQDTLDPLIGEDRYVVPRGLNVNLGFTVLHDNPPYTGVSSVFNSRYDNKNSSGY